jgi:hypothetical protein
MDTGFPGAAEKFCTLALASWRPQWSEAFTCVHFLDIEMIFAIDIDMGIPGGPDMGKITVLTLPIFKFGLCSCGFLVHLP